MVKTRYMADDFDEGKDNKGNKKDSADFAQIMNVVNGVKGHVKGLNPVTFETLRTTLANVLASNPEVAEFANIKEIFEQLELALKEEEQRVQAATAALINDKDRAAEAKRLEEEAAEKAREEIARRAEVEGVYKAFDSFYPEALNTQRKDNENLRKVFEATKADRPLTEAEKEKFKKKPEQIAKEKAHSQHMELTKTIAEREHKYHSENLEKVNKEIAVRPPHEHQEIAHLVQKKDYHKNGLSEAEKKKEQYEVFHKERCQYAKNICLAKKVAKEKGCNEDIAQSYAKVFQEIHDFTPEDMSQLTTEQQQHQNNFIVLPPSENPTTKVSQQELDTTQITPDTNKKTDKQGRHIAENIRQTLAKTSKTSGSTPYVPKAKVSNTGRGGRD